MNAVSSAFFGGPAFRRQRDLTNWTYNPVHQMRKFHQRHPMQTRLGLGLLASIAVETYFPSKFKWASVVLWTYMACPEFYSVFYK